MATRLYLPASGSAPLGSLAVDAMWTVTTNMVRVPCATTKGDTALATKTESWPDTTTNNYLFWQFQSAPLAAAYDWATTDTVSLVIGKCGESAAGADSHLVYSVRVVSGDGATVRGTVGARTLSSVEFPLVADAATRSHNALTDNASNFSSQVGDRIVVEVGSRGITPSSGTSIQMRSGDPSATGDFALSDGLTTDLCSWVELSRTVSFSGGGPPAWSYIGRSRLVNAGIVGGLSRSTLSNHGGH